MSEESVAVPITPSAAGSAAVGNVLRDLRTAKGMSLEDASARLKFSVRQIQALESENWDMLPRGVSLRGMIRNYARFLGADPDAIEASIQGRGRQVVSARPSMHELGELGAVALGGVSREVPSGGSKTFAWVVIAVIVVIAAGLAYALWQGWLPALADLLQHALRRGQS